MIISVLCCCVVIYTVHADLQQLQVGPSFFLDLLIFKCRCPVVSRETNTWVLNLSDISKVCNEMSWLVRTGPWLELGVLLWGMQKAEASSVEEMVGDKALHPSSCNVTAGIGWFSPREPDNSPRITSGVSLARPCSVEGQCHLFVPPLGTSVTGCWPCWVVKAESEDVGKTCCNSSDLV